MPTPNFKYAAARVTAQPATYTRLRVQAPKCRKAVTRAAAYLANIDIYALSRHQIKKAAAHAAAKAGTDRRLHVQPPNVRIGGCTCDR